MLRLRRQVLPSLNKSKMFSGRTKKLEIIISKLDKSETGMSLADFHNVGKTRIVSFCYKEAYRRHVLKVYV